MSCPFKSLSLGGAPQEDTSVAHQPMKAGFWHLKDVILTFEVLFYELSQVNKLQKCTTVFPSEKLMNLEVYLQLFAGFTPNLKKSFLNISQMMNRARRFLLSAHSSWVFTWKSLGTPDLEGYRHRWRCLAFVLVA